MDSEFNLPPLLIQKSIANKYIPMNVTHNEVQISREHCSLGRFLARQLSMYSNGHPYIYGQNLIFSILVQDYIKNTKRFSS